MKTISISGFLLVGLALHAQTTDQAAALPTPIRYAVVSQDANSALWQRQIYDQGPNGTVVTNVHRYTELATGLNHLVNGQWIPSTENIVISADGSSAMATNGQHQVYFPGNIYNGDIKLVMPDGMALQSQPIGLSYFDGSNSVLLAVVTNSSGAILSSGNQVIYTNAFAGLDADLLYTYTKAGFEQDVVLRQQPPDPVSLGLNSASTRLQVLTEFINRPQPGILTMTVPTAAGSLEDDNLSFGSMIMGEGRAFLIGSNSPSAAVSKRWLTLNGRQFLIEEVPIVSVAQAIDTLPPLVAKAGTGTKPVVSKNLLLPPPRLVHAVPKSRFLTQAAPPRNGLVLDYVTLNGNFRPTNTFTFQGDTTYFITGVFSMAGTNTFEGGAVIKFTNNASLKLAGAFGVPLSINWLGGAYRPVVFTAMDDDSVGETINNSSGTPTNYYANPALSIITGSGSYNITGFRIAHARQAVSLNNANARFYDGQIVNCQGGFSGASYIVQGYLRNVLFSHVQTNLDYLNWSTFGVQNATFDSSAYLTTINNTPYTSNTVNFTNCIIANVTNSLGTFFSGNGNSSGGSYQTNGGFNGFYNSPSFGTSQSTNNFYPFQAVGGGGYYLANGCAFTNAGTTNLDPVLLTNLQSRTTYPPIAYTNATFASATTFNPQVQRDADVPDLGYHYDPLDYSFGGCMASNSLTFTAGTAVGWFRTTSGSYHAGYGIHLAPDVTVFFNGTATAPTWWTRLTTVQEQDLTAGYGPGGIESWTNVNSPTVIGHFLKCSNLAKDNTSYFSDDGGNIVAQMTDCEFWTGNLGFNQDYTSFTNCLMWRVATWLTNGTSTSSLTLRNCTFWNGSFGIYRNSSGPTPVSVRDCSFDGTSISTGDYWGGNSGLSDYDYNAYTNSTDPFSIGGSHDQIVTGGFNWVTGPFGNYYLPSSSPIISKGDVTGDQVGLYHFTTQTNLTYNSTLNELTEVCEGAKSPSGNVDIGYHYAAVDQYGNPLDSNGDGIPDYIEDANGNGVVDSGEIGWNIPGDLGLNVIITRPRNGSILP